MDPAQLLRSRRDVNFVQYALAGFLDIAISCLLFTTLWAVASLAVGLVGALVYGGLMFGISRMARGAACDDGDDAEPEDWIDRMERDAVDLELADNSGKSALGRAVDSAFAGAVVAVIAVVAWIFGFLPSIVVIIGFAAIVGGVAWWLVVVAVLCSTLLQLAAYKLVLELWESAAAN